MCDFFFLLSYCVYMGAAPWWAWGWLLLDMVFIPRLDVVDTGLLGVAFGLGTTVCMYLHTCICVYVFIQLSAISVYLKKIKVVSITSELILYHFTSD